MILQNPSCNTVDFGLHAETRRMNNFSKFNLFVAYYRKYAKISQISAANGWHMMVTQGPSQKIIRLVATRCDYAIMRIIA